MSSHDWDPRIKDFRRHPHIGSVLNWRIVENHIRPGTRQDASAKAGMRKMEKGGGIYEFRTFLRHNSVADQIQCLQSVV